MSQAAVTNFLHYTAPPAVACRLGKCARHKSNQRIGLQAVLPSFRPYRGAGGRRDQLLKEEIGAIKRALGEIRIMCESAIYTISQSN